MSGNVEELWALSGTRGACGCERWIKPRTETWTSWACSRSAATAKDRVSGGPVKRSATGRKLRRLRSWTHPAALLGVEHAVARAAVRESGENGLKELPLEGSPEVAVREVVGQDEALCDERYRIGQQSIKVVSHAASQLRSSGWEPPWLSASP